MSGREGWRSLVTAVGLGLVAASIVRELRLPSAERSWHGTLFGWVPYDWRVPTPRRVVGTLWDRQNPHLVRPTVFGVGWTINFAALFR